jgi:cell wall-associated NlpC family hydrolase
MGERACVFAIQEGWAFVQLERDRYVGYVSADALSLTITEPTHRVSVPSTFLYPAPNLKSQPAVVITMNATVSVVGGDEKFAQVSGGDFIYQPHLKPIAENETDFVTVAEMFRHVPYYWGGKSVHGLDCSGLVQLSLEACGVNCLRDSDMQEENLGIKLMINDLDGLTRGDLVFWDGHVGIMTDEQTEPLRQAVDRIATTGKLVTSIKRL